MRTALYGHHCALGGRMVDFAGWEMPLQYVGVLEEHRAVREGVGIFDVSHMGRIFFRGAGACGLLDRLCVGDVGRLRVGGSLYTVWCHDDGGAVDDMIVYRRGEEEYFAVVNAGNRENDLAHVRERAGDVEVEARYVGEGIVAVQGPLALEVMGVIFSGVGLLAPMTFMSVGECDVARAGYTGAGGYEVYGPEGAIVALWEECLRRGARPVGLGARDTLRLEMGYALYGHELSEAIAPTESVAAWTVCFGKGDFIGKKALLELEQSPKKRAECGIVIDGGAIAREGARVYVGGVVAGRVTSGTFSPTLKVGIALALVDRKIPVGEPVEVEVRGKKLGGHVVKLPFIGVKR